METLKAVAKRVFSGKTILGINLGSTSTEIGILQDDGSIDKTKLRHDDSLLIKPVSEQLFQRRKEIKKYFGKRGVLNGPIDAIACRGGRLKPVCSGTYLVNTELLEDSKSTVNGDHASRLSVLIGFELKESLDCPIFISDPISVNEFCSEARMTGIRNVTRTSLGHILNSKYVAKKMSGEIGVEYEKANLIVAHLGGGASISAHRNGEIIDLINDFEGSLTPERSGALANKQVVELCKTLGYETVSGLIEGKGGFYSYLGSKDFSSVVKKMKTGDALATQLFNTYIYMNTKSIAALCGILDFKIQGFALTGGISNESEVVKRLEERFSRFAPFYTYPGSFEMEALLENAFLAISGEIPILSYPSGAPL